MFYGHADLVKIRLSMARLLTIVNERKKLRNEYRKHLEDQYIAERKAAEKAAEQERIEKLRE
jgi:large subunit ribosomal protein L47